MKIGIVTIYDFYNQGNRLQNYALEQVLIKMGHEVETFAITPKKIYIFYLKLGKLFPCKRTRRIKNCQKWSDKYLHQRIIDSCTFEELKERAKSFDYFVVGSDQVFNPRIIADENVTFLKFVEKEKALAYAPSFGVEKLADELKPKFVEGLSHISGLSVRENEGAKLIKELIGKDVPVLVDPTMLLTKEDWESFSKLKPVKEKYILTYFLNPKSEYKKKVKKIAKENNLKVININSNLDKYYTSDPCEFVGLMRNADMICTNSFHGTVFSIMLEKPFIYFDTSRDTKSRIKTLLSKMHLENRNNLKIDKNDYFSVDFSFAKNQLEEERKKSAEFLKSVLK